eukprot:jgi/Pico_ML_1/54241/g43.t1
MLVAQSFEEEVDGIPHLRFIRFSVAFAVVATGALCARVQRFARPRHVGTSAIDAARRHGLSPRPSGLSITSSCSSGHPLLPAPASATQLPTQNCSHAHRGVQYPSKLS